MEFLEREAAALREARYSDGASLKFLFVGDSYTAGELAESGVGYWYHVPAELRRLAGLSHVETISLAVSGSPTTFHASQLEAFLEESSQVPDYAVIITGANNLHAYEFQHRYCTTVRDAPVSAPVLALYRAPRSLFHAVQWTTLLTDHGPFRDDERTVTFGPLRRYWSGHDGYLDWATGYTCEQFTRFVESARAAGAEPIAGSYHSQVDVEAIRSLAIQLGVPFFDFERIHAQRGVRLQDIVSSDGWHLNDAGQEFLAAEFSRWFVEEVRLAPQGALGGSRAR